MRVLAVRVLAMRVACAALAFAAALFLDVPLGAAAQEVIPGAPAGLTTPDVAPDHWVMDAVRRAEGLGLLQNPLPFRRAVSLHAAAAALEQARDAAVGRGAALESLTEGWRQRFDREYGGVAGGGAVGEPRLLGLRASAAAYSADGLHAPGYAEVGAGRTGAVPLSDEAWVGVEGEAVIAYGEEIGLLLQPAVRTDGVELRRIDLSVSRGNWKLSIGRQPVGLAKSPAAGLVLSGAVPLGRIEVRREQPAVIPGFLDFLGPVGFQTFIGRLWDDERHAREPYLWGGSLSVQPFPRLGLAAHRAVMFGGHDYDAPLTLKTVVDMLIGRVANLGFENQIVSVEARYRMPTEGWVPLTAFVEWGAEDAAGGWWDVPGRVIGLETPAVPGLEALALGAAYTDIAAQCCGNSPWYRHHAFNGNWAAEDQPLGHPLGGQGSEWLAYGSYDRPGRDYRVEGRVFRRDREGQNLYVPGREESHGGEVGVRWIERHDVEIDARAGVESGSGWTELRLGVGANLYF